ncbi:MAG: hypothetical protein Q4B28_07165 [bacterium]|nr:hypothetical protein [bacterium]
MSFSSLSSNQNQNQLKAHMRDALISKLNTRASNHELRIATYAQSSSHPQLSNQQLSFNSYLSTNNNNMLTAQMWDSLTTQFGNTISNHEMRIRCIEDGSCLNTSHCPTTPSNPTPTPEEWHCVGNYQDGSQLVWQPKPNMKPKLECRSYTTRSGGARVDVLYERTDPNWCRNRKRRHGDKLVGWVFEQSGKRFLVNMVCGINSNGDEYSPESYTCHYLCPAEGDYDTKYCEQVPRPVTKSCSSLNESACKKQTGCSRVKK